MVQKYVRICPNCGSTEIKSGGGISVSGYCENCGYGEGGLSGHVFKPNGVFFPEVEIADIEEFRLNLEKNKFKDYNKKVYNRILTRFWKIDLLILFVGFMVLIFHSLFSFTYPTNLILASISVLVVFFRLYIVFNSLKNKEETVEEVFDTEENIDDIYLFEEDIDTDSKILKLIKRINFKPIIVLAKVAFIFIIIYFVFITYMFLKYRHFL